MAKEKSVLISEHLDYLTFIYVSELVIALLAIVFVVFAIRKVLENESEEDNVTVALGLLLPIGLLLFIWLANSVSSLVQMNISKQTFILENMKGFL